MPIRQTLPVPHCEDAVQGVTFTHKAFPKQARPPSVVVPHWQVVLPGQKGRLPQVPPDVQPHDTSGVQVPPMHVWQVGHTGQVVVVVGAAVVVVVVVVLVVVVLVVVPAAVVVVSSPQNPCAPGAVAMQVQVVPGTTH